MTAPARSRLLAAGLLALILLLVALVSGCATSLPVPAEVRIPVPVPCLDAEQVPARPALTPDGILRALPAGDLVLTLARERARLAAYAAEAEPLLDGCAVR